MVEIYPREGTETNAYHTVSEYRQLKFIPVRGRKHLLSPPSHTARTLKFIPVRGRKRDDLLVVLHFDC